MALYEAQHTLRGNNIKYIVAQDLKRSLKNPSYTVFASTLDCNIHIYSYCTDDDSG